MPGVVLAERNSVTDEFSYWFKKRLLFPQTAETVDGDQTTHSGADDISVSTAAAAGSPSRDGRDGIQGSLSILHTHPLSRFGRQTNYMDWDWFATDTDSECL